MCGQGEVIGHYIDEGNDEAREMRLGEMRLGEMRLVEMRLGEIRLGK